MLYSAKIYTAITLVILITLHITVRTFSLYFFFPWTEVLAHVIGGVFLGFLCIVILNKLNAFGFDWNNFLCVFGFVLISSFLFEVLQFTINHFFPYKQNNFMDSISDIVISLIGAVFAYLIFYFLEKKNE